MGSHVIGEGRKGREAVRLLHERGLDGLVVYSDGSCNILRASYLRYFAEYAPLGPHAAAVIASNGAVTLLVQPGWDVARAKRHTWIEDVTGTDDLSHDLPATLDRLGIAGRVGLVGGRQLPHPVYEALAGAVEVKTADEMIEFIAAEKSAQELALVHRAATAADAGFEAFRQSSRVGMREYEIVAEVEYAMRSAGADDNFILISTGPHNRAMRAPTDRRVERGDIVIGEITPVCEGQFFQLCRTVSVGEPNAALVSAYDLLLRAYAAAVSRVRTGVSASTVATAIDEVLSDAGYGEYCRPPYMRTRGHGFGIGSVAPGALIDADTNEELIDEQVLVVHPNQYLPETGYLACGETLLVHPDGAERLAATETKLWINEP
jgi:Xaa-Pro aminopeptidase